MSILKLNLDCMYLLYIISFNAWETQVFQKSPLDQPNSRVHSVDRKYTLELNMGNQR